MDEFVNIINRLGSPYTDIVWVLILFLLTVLFTYLLAWVTEKKAVKHEAESKDIKEPETSQPPAEEISSEDITETTLEVKDYTEPKKENIQEQFTSPQVESDTVKQEIPDAFKPPVHKNVPHEQTQAERDTEEKVQVTAPAEINSISGEAEEERPKEDFFARLKKGLSKTHSGIFGKLDNIFQRNEIDMDLWDDFEESLITADLGVPTTMKLREDLEAKLTSESLNDPLGIKDALKEEIHGILKSVESGPLKVDHKPTIIMVAGANGVGKTTTIGKLAYKFINEGKRVMIAAGDTFRAAAVEQLEVWSKRVGADFIKTTKGADPSSVAFDAVQSSLSKGVDLLIIDTAGRLHTKSNLMEELSKIKRVVGNKIEGAPHEVLLVLDATTGQNAIQQAKTFKEAIDVTGIILTKLDGTSKGGVIVGIADELKISVKYIGIGEALDDLREFKADEFVEALFLSEGETIH